jgi:hypothetical protein
VTVGVVFLVLRFYSFGNILPTLMVLLFLLLRFLINLATFILILPLGPPLCLPVIFAVGVRILLILFILVTFQDGVPCIH